MITLLQKTLEALGSFFSYLRDKRLFDAGQNKEKLKAAHERIREIATAKALKVNIVSGTIASARERLRALKKGAKNDNSKQ